MKKILIGVLSLLVVVVFLAGCAKEEALAGEAFKTAGKIAQLKEGKCKYVDFPSINNVWSGQTYEWICANQGGMSCTAVDVKEITYVFENSACNPPTRWRNTNNVLHPELCNGIYNKDLRHLFPEEECTEGSFPPTYDPSDSSEYYASKSDFVNLDGVLCCT